MLDSSMDRYLRHFTMEFLGTLRILATSNLPLLVDCLDVLSSCMRINRGGGAVLTQGSE